MVVLAKVVNTWESNIPTNLAEMVNVLFNRMTQRIVAEKKLVLRRAGLHGQLMLLNGTFVEDRVDEAENALSPGLIASHFARLTDNDCLETDLVKVVNGVDIINIFSLFTEMTLLNPKTLLVFESKAL